MRRRISPSTGGRVSQAGGSAGPPARAPQRTYEYWRWRIFSITWLAYAGFYLTRKAFSVAKNELKQPAIMGLTRGDMSWIDGANSVAYALGQFLFGTLGDRLGTR